MHNNNHQIKSNFQLAHLDKMHAATADTNSGFQGLPLRVRPLEQRKQRRMNVDETSAPLSHKLPAQNAHETRQTDDFDSETFQLFSHRPVKVRTVREVLVAYHLFFNNVLRRKYTNKHDKSQVTFVVFAYRKKFISDKKK